MLIQHGVKESVVNIIGGSGFIGTRLCQLLNKKGKNNFSIIDKTPSKAFSNIGMVADVRSVDELRESISEGGVIINLAAEHRDDIRPLSLYNEVNVDGARNICKVAREKGVKSIIFTSTTAVYGFAPIGTDESGEIAPFNAYGRTKYEAEQIFREWQIEAPEKRSLTVIRPTVVFGEQNRGNVYNLFRHIANTHFVMVGDGKNRKSIAYVENVAAFLEYALTFGIGVHTYNYVDKPDLTMNELLGTLNRILGKREKIGLRIPYTAGFIVGKGFDMIAALTGKRFQISSIRIKKFVTNSVYNTAIDKAGFVAPVSLTEAIERTVRYEFLESHKI